MHLLAAGSATLDDLIEPVDHGRSNAELVALSFTDSDLGALAAAWKARKEEEDPPSLRLLPLRELRHPMSVDLWVDGLRDRAKVVLVRILGGYDWWRYGCDRLSETARREGIALALLPGECRDRDETLERLSTISPADYEALLACFREGGAQNMGATLARMARLAGQDVAVPEPAPLPRCGFYRPGEGVVPADSIRHDAQDHHPVVPILFYRSMLLAADIAPIDSLAVALEDAGVHALPIFLPSLKNAQARSFVEEACTTFGARAMIAATAFAVGGDTSGEASFFNRLGVPVFQAVVATTRREAWMVGQRGLGPADLAMHVVLPELDGRVLAGAISFKDVGEADESLGVRVQVNRPEPDRICAVAARLAAFLKLQATPAPERRIMIMVPDYPAATGRAGYAVGLDVPQSVLAMLEDLKGAGYGVSDIPATPRELMRRLERDRATVPLADYERSCGRMDPRVRASIDAAWGTAAKDAEDGVFRFRASRFGNVTVCFAPDRGRSDDRRVDYHDPVLPPRHALVAFGLWMREMFRAHALVHVGAHGTLEWLPGKTVALSADCFPEIVTGSLPVVYPFIVSNPGEAAQAKRRIAAVTLGHLTPPLVGAGLSPEQQALERLVDEYAQADGLDRRRRDRLAELIVRTAGETGLSVEAGVEQGNDPDEALMRIDAWLCDLKDFAVKDGLHVFGRAAPDEADPARLRSAEAERTSLLAALNGWHVPPGPSGAPARGRSDVLPTGRNLFASDPRALPTETATALGRAAADEIVQSYLQEHGDYPRSLVMDLWGSASLRTGGEEIAQGLWLMGCRAEWDRTTGRVTGIEILPTAVTGRPRVDVTWRISGLFRDMFGSQIALIDAAVAAVAAREEDEGENPLAALARTQGRRPSRIFGSAPGTYGSGIEERLQNGTWEDRAELGQLYLDAASHTYGGANGEGRREEGAFADQVAEADLLVHAGDDPGRDILEGSADVAFIGGFAAALEALGSKADLVVLDTTDPKRPRARSLAQAVTRAVRARAVNPRFIEGQMRHGPRGASEFAETVDRLVGFAETTGAIPADLIEAVHDAYLGDERVREFLLHENPAAARAIAQRFLDARRRDLWHPLRNSLDHDLAEFLAVAEREEAL